MRRHIETADIKEDDIKTVEEQFKLKIQFKTKIEVETNWVSQWR